MRELDYIIQACTSDIILFYNQYLMYNLASDFFENDNEYLTKFKCKLNI